MAFILQNWSQIGVSTNTAGPACYAYISRTDNQATISAANYFASSAPFLNVGDFILISASDIADVFTVTSIQNSVFPYNVSIVNDSLNSPSDLIRVSTVTVSSADILNMYDTPVVLLSAEALGANYIIVDKAVFIFQPATTPYTIGGDMVIQYGSAPHGAGPAASVNTAGTGVLDQTATTLAWSPGSFISPVAGSAVLQTDICLSNLTADYSVGDGDMTILIWYQYI